MDRLELERYLTETYHADPEYPWEAYPRNTVFRHAGNKKWFALVLPVPRSSLGLPEEGTLDAVNVKCDPLLIGSFRTRSGVYPAYHMSEA